MLKLAPLPYAYDALEPHISERTLRLHHDKHHAGYVKKLNDLIEGTALAQLAQEEIVRRTADDPMNLKVFNNAAQSWNHAFFWRCMTPEGGGAPPAGDLAKAIDKSFGGLDRFKKAFTEAAVDQFGSGWVWLTLDGRDLALVHTPNAVNPIVLGQRPLLTCDVWEHAYYLDYENRRRAFVAAFLDHLVDWSFVEQQLFGDERLVA